LITAATLQLRRITYNNFRITWLCCCCRYCRRYCLLACRAKVGLSLDSGHML